MARFWLIVLAASLLVVPTLAGDEKENLQVWRGSDGSIEFRSLTEKRVTYEDSGFLITPEAAKYPNAVKELIAGGLDVVPVEMDVGARVVGLLTCKVNEEPTLVLAKEDRLIVVRKPMGAEAAQTEKQINVPIAALLAVSLVLTLLAIVLARRYPRWTIAVFVLATTAILGAIKPGFFKNFFANVILAVAGAMAMIIVACVIAPCTFINASPRLIKIFRLSSLLVAVLVTAGLVLATY